MTHEAFVHAVRVIAVDRIADPETRERLLGAKLVYGTGDGRYRGICYYRSWRNGAEHDLIEVAATGEESPVQLAGTTIHETAHVLAGPGAGHGAEWRAACRALGLSHAEAAGQAYAPEHFAPDIWPAIAAVPVPTDGVPTFASRGMRPAVGLPVAPAPRPCPLGIGTRGGRSRGIGSGSRLRLWMCACGVKVRVASDDFRAECRRCGSAFTRAIPTGAPVSAEAAR
jgi:hypothetical protein